MDDFLRWAGAWFAGSALPLLVAGWLARRWIVHRLQGERTAADKRLEDALTREREAARVRLENALAAEREQARALLDDRLAREREEQRVRFAARHAKGREVAEEAWRLTTAALTAYARYVSVMVPAGWPSEAERQSTFVDAANALGAYFRANSLALPKDVVTTIDAIFRSMNDHHIRFAHRTAVRPQQTDIWMEAFNAFQPGGRLALLQDQLGEQLREILS